jgi:hypothetical protein
VGEYELPVVSKLDRAFKPPCTYDAVEVESLGQGVVTEIIRNTLDQLLPEPLKDVRVRETRERKRVAALLRGLGGRAA